MNRGKGMAHYDSARCNNSKFCRYQPRPRILELILIVWAVKKRGLKPFWFQPAFL